MKKYNLDNINETGFKIPEDYFDTLESNLLDRIKTCEVLGNVDETGFKIPKDYFDTVETKIFNIINAKDETPVITFNFKKKLYYFSGIAASIILLIAIFINTSNTDELSVETVSHYLENRDLNSYELAELLSEIDVLNEEFTIAETNYDESNLESYLLQNTDIEYILE